MAGTSLLALIDDIATILDDVAVMSKVAAKKTAGVLGDDLALNAEKVTGVRADRELPVVWAVFKGSFLNKLILVPCALLISAFMPWAITPLLMLGGAFLCYEGFEKIAHKYLHSQDEDEEKHQQKLAAIANPAVDMVAFEKAKIKGAIRTDFILSAEIIVIALGTVQSAAFMMQVLVVSTIALLMTIGVYVLVAGIVKLDDAGLYLANKDNAGGWADIQRAIGRKIILAAPYLMKGLSIVGTIAMFMVGGGILVHGIPHSHEVLHYAVEVAEYTPLLGAVLGAIIPTLITALFGVLVGACILWVITMIQRFRNPSESSSS